MAVTAAVLRRWNANDRRTQASRIASAAVLALCDLPDRVVLGLGGGPMLIHPKIVNVNIEPFANVTVVGDAHRLPIADNSVDAVHCEAVFEHLADPHIAAAEMQRVMKPGAIAFVCTPFMQSFHGYPSHCQNFTHVGHCRLFDRAGLEIVESGTCVGPAWTLTGIILAFLSTYLPLVLRWPALAAWTIFSLMFIRPLDRWLASSDQAYVLASTTYVLVRKPITGPAE